MKIALVIALLFSPCFAFGKKLPLSRKAVLKTAAQLGLELGAAKVINSRYLGRVLQATLENGKTKKARKIANYAVEHNIKIKAKYFIKALDDASNRRDIDTTIAIFDIANKLNITIKGVKFIDAVETKFINQYTGQRLPKIID